MERREHLNETPGVEGKLAVAFDLATGEVRAWSSGFWSSGQARAFFKDWRWVVQRIHASGGRVSGLVDMTASSVQRADVAEIVATGTLGLYLDGDALAMLVPTSLAKMQMRRVLDPRFHDFFMSPAAAELWLSGRALMRAGRGAAA